jgi:hypothetical protein
MEKTMIRTISILALAVSLSAGSVLGAATEEMEAAAKAGKVAFILVYDQTAVALDQARQLTSEAVKQTPGSVLIELDRGDAANAATVTQYQLATAPVPLVIVASATGVITGGLVAAQATVDQLVKLVPSPKKAEILKAISEGNAVFITTGRKNMASTAALNSSCAAACQQMAGKCVQIVVDMDDPAEIGFLTDMKVDLQATEPVTLVANAQGQIAQVFTGVVAVGDLVTAATKKASSGCSPSAGCGTSSSCGPKKK